MPSYLPGSLGGASQTSGVQCAWQYKCPKILVRWMAEHWQSSFSYQLAFHFHLHFIFIFISICISHFILLVPQVHRTESWLCRASSMMEQVASRVGPWHELGAFLLSKPTGLSLRRRARKGQTALRSHMPQHYSDYWANLVMTTRWAHLVNTLAMRRQHSHGNATILIKRHIFGDW